VEPIGQATFLFKLRQNIALEGDLALARMELEAFLPERVRTVTQLSEMIPYLPQLGDLQGLAAVTSCVRSNGVQGMVAEGPLVLLPDLIHRLSFIQRIYCLTADSPPVRRWLAALGGTVGRVMAVHPAREMLLIQAIPHYALCELAGVVMRRAPDAGDLARALPTMVEALLNRPTATAGVRTADRALASLARPPLL
jgi:hypothetical protein